MKETSANIDLWIKFKKSRAYFRSVVKARTETWHNFLNNFSSKLCSSKLWKQIKILQNKPTSCSILLKEGDSHMTTQLVISEKLCEHFASRSDGTYL